MRRIVVLAACFLFLPLVAAADDPLSIRYPLSEADIEEALALGKHANTKAGLVLGATGFDFAPMADDSNRNNSFAQHRTSRRTSGFGVEIYTPFTWLTRIGRDQKAKGRDMLPRHVTDRLLDPVLHVLCFSDVPQQDLYGVYGTIVTDVTLRSTKKGVPDVVPTGTQRIPDRVRTVSGDVIDMGPLRADFALDEVVALSALDKKGEFFVVIVPEKGKEKKFKVKSKHFEKLP